MRHDETIESSERKILDKGWNKLDFNKLFKTNQINSNRTLCIYLAFITLSIIFFPSKALILCISSFLHDNDDNNDDDDDDENNKNNENNNDNNNKNNNYNDNNSNDNNNKKKNHHHTDDDNNNVVNNEQIYFGLSTNKMHEYLNKMLGD